MFSSVNRSPLSEVTPFNVNTLSVLKKYCDIPVCIVEGFNEAVLLNSTSPIFKMFTEEGCMQHVQLTTRDSRTLIDHIYTHKIERDIKSDV